MAFSKKPITFRALGMAPGATPMRSCAGCTACCTVLDVPELDAPSFVSCRHLTGGGCGIHATRPPICRSYHCEWARGFAPEWMKPNDCGVIPGHTPGNDAMQLWEVWAGAGDAPRIKAFIRQSNARGIHVVVGVFQDGCTPAHKNRVHLSNGEVREMDGMAFSGTFYTVNAPARAAS